MDPDFASVWNRVTGMRPAEDEAARLRRRLLDETEGIRAYEALLRRRQSSSVEKTLRALLQAERRHFRQLQTIYYLRTGDNWVPPPQSAQPPQPLMKALRERYEAALDQAESYRRGASEEKRDLAALCAALAREEEAQASNLRKLTGRLL